jgi:hypothetical protein
VLDADWLRGLAVVEERRRHRGCSVVVLRRK